MLRTMIEVHVSLRKEEVLAERLAKGGRLRKAHIAVVLGRGCNVHKKHFSTGVNGISGSGKCHYSGIFIQSPHSGLGRVGLNMRVTQYPNAHIDSHKE